MMMMTSWWRYYVCWYDIIRVWYSWYSPSIGIPGGGDDDDDNINDDMKLMMVMTCITILFPIALWWWYYYCGALMTLMTIEGNPHDIDIVGIITMLSDEQ